MAWREIIYQYDGSFEGLLCCVFESYTKKERPSCHTTNVVIQCRRSGSLMRMTKESQDLTYLFLVV